MDAPTANTIAEGICLAVERIAFGYFIVCVLCFGVSIVRDSLRNRKATKRRMAGKSTPNPTPVQPTARQSESSFDLRSYIGMGD